MSPLLLVPILAASVGVCSWLLARFVFVNLARSEERLRKHPRGMEEKDPYQLRKCIFTTPEENFFRTLVTVLPADCAVLAKVRVADLFNVTYGAGDRAQAHGRVTTKSFDFVVVSDAFAPLLAINMTTRSVDQEQLKNREFFERLSKKTGLPVVFVDLQPRYGAEEIRNLLAEHFPLQRLMDAENLRSSRGTENAHASESAATSRLS